MGGRLREMLRHRRLPGIGPSGATRERPDVGATHSLNRRPLSRAYCSFHGVELNGHQRVEGGRSPARTRPASGRNRASLLVCRGPWTASGVYASVGPVLSAEGCPKPRVHRGTEMQRVTRYAKSGDIHVACQLFGEGPDLVMVPGFVSHIENSWDECPSSDDLRRTV